MQQIEPGFWILFILSVMGGVLVGLSLLAGISLATDWVKQRRRKRR